jgi:hypothetical protein
MHSVSCVWLLIGE